MLHDGWMWSVFSLNAHTRETILQQLRCADDKLGLASKPEATAKFHIGVTLRLIALFTFASWASSCSWTSAGWAQTEQRASHMDPTKTCIVRCCKNSWHCWWVTVQQTLCWKSDLFLFSALFFGTKILLPRLWRRLCNSNVLHPVYEIVLKCFYSLFRMMNIKHVNQYWGVTVFHLILLHRSKLHRLFSFRRKSFNLYKQKQFSPGQTSHCSDWPVSTSPGLGTGEVTVFSSR